MNQLEKLRKRLKQPLPGAAAHEIMRATPVGGTIPRFEHKLPPKPGSVLITLYEKDGGLYIPFIKRPDYSGAHSGQVSFPGGKAEENETEIETALREASEEIGIDPGDISILGVLSKFFVIPSNFMITPVVGVASSVPQFKPDPYEVERILHGRLDDLMLNDSVRTSEIVAAKIYRMNAPHFIVDGEIVWGATAMILNEFREVWKSL